MRTIAIVLLAALGFDVAVPGRTMTTKTSGVYETAVDYKDGRLSFEGDCRSKAHKLELHDVLNKP